MLNVLFFKVQWDGSDVAVVWGRIAKEWIFLHPTLPWAGTEKRKTPTVQRCVLVSFLMGCCRNTVAQHVRHLGGQPALSVDINSHLKTHTHARKKILPKLINSLCLWKYPVLLRSSNKNDKAKQKLLTARFDRNGQTSSRALCVS